MTKDTALRALGPRIVTDETGEYIALALQLIHERSLGEDSFWAPYIGVLPSTEEVDCLFSCSEDDLALLEGSGAVDMTRSMQRKLRAEYNTLEKRLIDPGLLERAVYSFEAFEWAMAMLFSRGIDLKNLQTLAMVPYADLLNHSPYASSYFYTSDIPFSSEKEVVLYADRNYARNDQVLISYGARSNDVLLQYYGFVQVRAKGCAPRPP